MKKPPSEIHVQIITHEKTGLLVALSDDLKGLYAHGRTIDELESNVVDAIRDIIEATFGGHAEVMPAGDEPQTKGFRPKEMKFNAALAA